MSQCEGMHDAVKAGNVTTSERKRPAVFRKHAASRALTWNTVMTTHCLKKGGLVLRWGLQSACRWRRRRAAASVTWSLTYSESHLRWTPHKQHLSVTFSAAGDTSSSFCLFMQTSSHLRLTRAFTELTVWFKSLAVNWSVHNPAG